MNTQWLQHFFLHNPHNLDLKTIYCVTFHSSIRQQVWVASVISTTLHSSAQHCHTLSIQPIQNGLADSSVLHTHLESPCLLRWTWSSQRKGCWGRNSPTHRARNCQPYSATHHNTVSDSTVTKSKHNPPVQELVQQSVVSVFGITLLCCRLSFIMCSSLAVSESIKYVMKIKNSDYIYLLNLFKYWQTGIGGAHQSLYFSLAGVDWKHRLFFFKT